MVATVCSGMAVYLSNIGADTCVLFFGAMPIPHSNVLWHVPRHLSGRQFNKRHRPLQERGVVFPLWVDTKPRWQPHSVRLRYGLQDETIARLILAIESLNSKEYVI